MASEETKMPEEQDTAAAEGNAEERAAQAVGSVLLEDLERQYLESINERESLKGQLGETENERDRLQELLLKQQEINKTLNEANNRAEVTEGKLKTAETKYVDSQERVDRMQVENDKLRDELSQLNAKNTDLTKQLASEQIQSKLKESEAIPLVHEKERAQTNLDAVQSHASWLQQELDAKQKDCQRIQTQSRDRILQLQLQLNQNTDELAEAQTKVSVLEKVESDLQHKLSQLTKDNLTLKTEMQEAELEAKKDLQDKEGICELQKEHIARWKTRCEDAQRECEALQQTAQKALEAGDEELQEAKNELKTKYATLLQDQKAHYEAKLSQFPLASQDLAITQGAEDPDENEDGPFEMTELLQRWEDAKRSLRTERWNHDRLKRTYNRLVKEVRDKTPRMARQREEFDIAIERNEALEKRLKDALQEKEHALADAKDAQTEASNFAKQLKRREEEAKTLARQVQALLIKQSGGEPSEDIPISIEEIQEQNLRLLDEHRRMSVQIEEFESRLNSDRLKSELDSKSSEVDRLVEERERQQKLVERIVQQRDLYRALVNRHDNEALGSESNELSMSDIVQKQSVKLQSMEKSNRSLADKLQQAHDSLDSAARDKSIFQDRCKRYEVANAELASATDDLQSKLLAAKSEGAKSLAEGSYYKEKCTRLEQSVDRYRGEIAQLDKNRAEIQETAANVENALAKATAAQGRLESENRAYESKLRSLETRLETEKATATRYAQVNGQLREDISRQGAMIDHIRRIENSISAKNETDMTGLREQLSAATEKIGALETKHSAEIIELTGKLSDSQGKVATLQIASAKFQRECLEAKKECLEAKTEYQSSKSLNLEGRREEHEKIEHALKAELQSLKDKMEGQREEREKIEHALKAEIQSLKDKIASDEALVSSTKASFEAYKVDIEKYQKEVAEAQENYERELSKHAEARTAVRSAQEAAAEHQYRREKADDELKTLQGEVAVAKETFNSEHEKLKSEIATLQTRVEEARDQNKLLYAQLDSINASIDKRTKSFSEAQDSEVEETAQQKTIAELREIIKYLRSENEVSQTDLDAKKRAIDREKASTEVLRRSLEELRSELQGLREAESKDDQKSSTEELSLQLEEKTHQLRVLNDSNKLLREDAERLTQKLQKIEVELATAKTETQPIDDIKQELASKIATLESENTSLRRELDSWKSRMSNLAKNLDQIDPEDHRKLLLQVEEMTKEKDSLNAWKTATENENKRIRVIATRMKKLNEEHQSTIDKQKKEISTLHGEKENLRKNSNTNLLVVKERDDLKTKVAQIEKEKAAVKTELEGANTNSDRLRDSLRRFKEKIISLEQELATTRATASASNEAKIQKSGSTEATPKVPHKSNEEKLPPKPSTKASTSVTVLATEPIPKIPVEGFKFGPSAKTDPPVRSDAPKEAQSRTSLMIDGKETKPIEKKPSKNDAEKPVKRLLSGENKEMSMKEKLLMKKKKLEQEVQEGLKRKQALNEAEKKPKRSKTDSEEKVGDFNATAKREEIKEPSSSIVKLPPKEDPKPVLKEAAKLEATGVQGDDPKDGDGTAEACSLSTNETQSSAADLILAQGLRPSAPPFAPTFGTPSSAPTFGSFSSPFGTTGEGAFLNMKPPGKSGATTFSFGSKPNITLPTPTVPQSPTPFGAAFRSASSSSLGGTKPLFGESTSNAASAESKDEAPKDKTEE